MAAIIRFFSRRFRRNAAPTPGHVEEPISANKFKKVKKSDIECKVAYLDGTEQTFYVSKNAKGAELYDMAFAFVALVEEKDYFGLQFINDIPMWLDPTKEIRKQYKNRQSILFSLRVKFFASDPHNFHDEYTRYLVVLQLREDIHKGKLVCNDLQLAAELAALLLQGEFGDYDRKQHTPVFVSTFRFLPEEKQTEEFELAVLDKYKALAGRNLTPAATESIYLEKVCQLPDYGVDIHIVKGKDNALYSLGLTPTGILVYEGQNKIGLFFWPKILKLEMKNNKLKILVADEDEKSHKITEHAFCFVLPDNKTCKVLWKSAVEHHAFFRLTDRVPVQPKKKQLFRLRSRFHPSFNTEYQLHNLNMFGSSSFRKRKKANPPGASSAPSSPSTSKPSSPMPSSGQPTSSGASGSTTSFRRVPSKRFTSRPSFAKREANIENKREKRERVAQSKEQTRKEFFSDMNKASVNYDITQKGITTTQISNTVVRREHENPPSTKSSPIIFKHNTVSNSGQHGTLIQAPTKPPRKPEVKNSIFHKNNVATKSKFGMSAESKQW
ncbi:Band 4.1-like protein 5 [Schistosoma japonicum]|nr:Band 4.1-like protein 5 [Schistosoma japonicum]